MNTAFNEGFWGAPVHLLILFASAMTYPWYSHSTSILWSKTAWR